MTDWAEILKKLLGWNCSQALNVPPYLILLIVDVGSFVQVMEFQEKTFRGALQRLVTLGQRVSFATKRVDTIQGKKLCSTGK